MKLKITAILLVTASLFCQGQCDVLERIKGADEIISGLNERIEQQSIVLPNCGGGADSGKIEYTNCDTIRIIYPSGIDPSDLSLLEYVIEFTSNAANNYSEIKLLDWNDNNDSVSFDTIDFYLCDDEIYAELTLPDNNCKVEWVQGFANAFLDLVHTYVDKISKLGSLECCLMELGFTSSEASEIAAYFGELGQSVAYDPSYWSDPLTYIRALECMQGEDRSVLTSVESIAIPMISFYPSPAADYVNIQSNVEISNIVILDAAGRAVINRNFHDSKIRLGLSDLKPGLYFAQIQFDNGSIESKRLIKE